MFFSKKREVFFGCAMIFVLVVSGCSSRVQKVSSETKSTDKGSTNAERVEKAKPAPGTANVQGQVFYKNQPAERVEIKFCKQLSYDANGCKGETYTAMSDSSGEYLITNIKPGQPGERFHVLARLSGTRDYIFTPYTDTSANPKEYYPKAGETTFADPIHLFKADLQLLSPHDNTELDVSFFKPEFSWQSYPEAAYYKIVFFITDPHGNLPTYGLARSKRVDKTSYTAENLRQGSSHWWKVEAFSEDDVKIAESDVRKFTVTKEK